MKKVLKKVSLLMAVLMLFGCLCACSDEKDFSKDGKYTYWAAMSSTSMQTLTSYSELMMYQEMAKRTGIEVEFIHPATGSTGSEAFQILLSSGDYPDMIEYRWTNYAGGAQKAIDDGVIISLNEYMEDYAPNYYDYMEGEKGKENGYLYKAQSITNSGNYYGFNNMNIGTHRGFFGPYVRKDLLEKWNLDIPQTIDDWELVLKTAKENGFRAPLTGGATMFSITGVETFNTAWNVGKDWYVDDGKIKYGPMEKAYKEYIKRMAEWTKKGYIDPDYITNDGTNVEGYMTNGTSMAAFGYIGSGIGKLLPAMAQRDPEYDLVACPYPVMKKGDIPWFQEVQPESNGPSIAISTQCGLDNEDRYKAAISWCDYLYSEEGTILKCFGIENDTFVIEKGEDGKDHFVYTDKIKDHEKIGAHDVEAALYHFFRPANSPGLNQHPDYLNGFYPYKQQIDAFEVWNLYVDEAKKHVLPPLSYTDEEATQKANIEIKITDNLDAAISNIILGKADVKSLDSAIENAKKGGLKDLIKIQQDAYDRYIKVVNESK